MKARQKTKKSISIEDIYKRIKEMPETVYKTFFHHSEYISDEIKMQLISDGYKVYIGDWDAHCINCLIIEW